MEPKEYQLMVKKDCPTIEAFEQLLKKEDPAFTKTETPKYDGDSKWVKMAENTYTYTANISYDAGTAYFEKGALSIAPIY